MSMTPEMQEALKIAFKDKDVHKVSYETALDNPYREGKPEVLKCLPDALAFAYHGTPLPNGHSTKQEVAAAKAAPVEAHDDVAFRDYQNYVSAIFRPGDTLCFLGIVHKTNEREQDFVPYEKAISREYFDELSKNNEHGSIYVATNTFPASLIGKKEGRTQENVVDVRAVQADVDYNGAETMNAIKSSASVPQPSIIVESSPGKFQGIWLVDGISKADAKPLMQAIASEFKTDAAVAEVARVMRVPGFVNRKYDSAPIAKTLVQTNTRYTRTDFKLPVSASENFEKKNPDGWVKEIRLQHGNINNQLVKLAGYYVRAHNADDPDVLYTLLAKHCETAVDYDGVTPYHCNMEEVRQIAEKKSQEFETKAEYEARTKLSLTSTTPGQQPTAQTPQQTVAVDTSKWREQFRSVGQMEKGPILEVINGVLQEGTCFIGGSAGDCKTLIGLSWAKAISTATSLFGLFNVPEKRRVIYLIPETRDRAFRQRCEDFRMPDDDYFLVRTASLGPTLSLDDPYLLRAISETQPVIFLDTAVRFMKTADENSAAQNKMLVDDVIRLLQHGAVSVVLVHHATKASQNEAMTLENMLRGTSDFAAMCDQVYGVRKDRTLYQRGKGPLEVDLVSLKDREQTSDLTEIRLAASRKAPAGSLTPTISIIRETGNFRVVSDTEACRRETQALEALVKSEPNIPAKEIASRLDISEYRVKTQLEKLGYHRVQGGPTGASPWHRDENGACPFEKKEVVEAKPSKKTYDLALANVVKELEALLVNTSPSPEGNYVAETDALRWADKRGIPESLLNKAKRRLGVVVGKDGDIKTWALPGEPDADQADVAD